MKALSLLQKKPSQAIVVGDSWWDIRGASRINATSVWVRTRFGAYNNFSKERLSIVLDNLGALLKHINGLGLHVSYWDCSHIRIRQQPGSGLWHPQFFRLLILAFRSCHLSFLSVDSMPNGLVAQVLQNAGWILHSFSFNNPCSFTEKQLAS